MKLSIATFTLLPALKASTFEQIKGYVEAIIPPGVSNNNESLRALTQSDMNLVNNYGCWCYFEENHGKGRGHPIDTLDTICKTLHEGYECIILDHGESCVPWEVAFTPSNGFGLTAAQVTAQCDASNAGDDCALAACKVEGWFVQQYLSFSLGGGVVDASKRHVNGFEISTGCPITAGVKSERACCGEYPSRFSFKDYNGARDCCNGATYNTLMLSCCDDGSIQSVCP